jgi:hypothetical protein
MTSGNPAVATLESRWQDSFDAALRSTFASATGIVDRMDAKRQDLTKNSLLSVDGKRTS